MPVSELQLGLDPFDGIAEHYDSIFTESPIGQAQRSSVWEELRSLFPRGSHVLEIGCGTGVDACFLAELGVSVTACDRSRQMVRMAEMRVRHCSSRFQNAFVLPSVMAAEKIGTLDREHLFDGAFSNFGVLNCVPDLRKFAEDLAALLKRRAQVMLCLMGPCCAWEMAWFLMHGQRRRAFRRLTPHLIAAHVGEYGVISVGYPTVREMKRIFEPMFRLRGVKGVGLLVPPTYVGHSASRFSYSMNLARSADRFLSRFPGIRVLADHILLTFERS